MLMSLCKCVCTIFLRTHRSRTMAASRLYGLNADDISWGQQHLSIYLGDGDGVGKLFWCIDWAAGMDIQPIPTREEMLSQLKMCVLGRYGEAVLLGQRARVLKVGPVVSSHGEKDTNFRKALLFHDATL
jgi:hypothetical protein